MSNANIQRFASDLFMEVEKYNSAEADKIKAISSGYNLPPLSRQHERLVMFYSRGASLGASARASGIPFDEAKKLVREDDTIKAYLAELVDQELRGLKIDRESITNMLLTAHDTADTSTAAISAIKEIAKLHDLYPKTIDTPQQTQLTVITEASLKRMAKMSDEELAALVDSPEIIDAEFEDVD